MMDSALRDRLAASGEELARVSHDFMSGSSGADLFLNAARSHMNALRAAGQAPDAFATGVMTLVSALFRRFNPESCPVDYLTMLLQLAIDGALAQQSAMMAGDDFAMEHYQAIDSELGPLVLASYRALDGASVLPAHLCRPFEELSEWTDPTATFRGEPIKATMALDILCDVASRLAAMGIIEANQ